MIVINYSAKVFDADLHIYSRCRSTRRGTSVIEGVVNLLADLADVLEETGTRLGLTMSEVAANGQLSTEDGEPMTSVAVLWGITIAPLISTTGEILADIDIILGKLADAFWP